MGSVGGGRGFRGLGVVQVPIWIIAGIVIRGHFRAWACVPGDRTTKNPKNERVEKVCLCALLVQINGRQSGLEHRGERERERRGDAAGGGGEWRSGDVLVESCDEGGLIAVWTVLSVCVAGWGRAGNCHSSPIRCHANKKFFFFTNLCQSRIF